jgi:hypothetical protein
MSVATESTVDAILARTINSDTDDLPVPLARAIVRLRLRPGDVKRMHELAAKARDGTLTQAEQEEAENYDQATLLLSLLQSMARQALKRSKRS